MDEPRNQSVTLCRACQGDVVASKDCRTCGGAGMGLPSSDGILVWMAAVDDFSLAFRKTKRIFIVGLHLLLIICSLLTVIGIVWMVMQLPMVVDSLTWSFWTSGHPFVTAFWAGLLLDCFIIFRLSEYGHDVLPLPTWGHSHTWMTAYETNAPERAKHRFDVSPYFSDSAWDVIEGAYRLARNLKRTEITNAHLFAAAISSPSGSLFLTRLGLTFDALKEPLARLIGGGESGSGTPPLSKDARRALILAYRDAVTEHRKYTTVIEIFLQAFLIDPKLQALLDDLGYTREQVAHVAEWIRLQDKLREDHERFVQLAMLKPKGEMNRSMTARATPLLARFSEDLTHAARNGMLQPLVGREREMEELLRAIEGGRRSVVLVGESGSGRSALVEGLARRMVEEDVPEELFDRRLVAINVPQLIGAGDPALASERLFAVLEEVALSGNIILVLHGIEVLSGGEGHGPLDLAESLAGELEKGYCIAIGTTTPRAYTQYIERRSLGAKLTRVDIGELKGDEAIRVCLAKSAGIEYHHRVFFTYAAVERAVTLSSRYLHERALPEKALDVLREAAVSVHKQRGDRAFVSPEDVAAIVHEKTNVPVEAVSRDESTTLLQLEQKIHGRIIGQDAAVTAVAQALRRARTELREGKRPIANFLFLGPTGVGKTELSKALAEQYFGSEQSMVRMDMSEYQNAAAVARMIGSSGDERGGLLTEAVRAKPFTIVLLDEIEKAHPDILNLFLQVMDDGRLTDGVGRTVDFTNTLLIATSNAGTPFIQEEVKKSTDVDRIKTMLLERELKGTFRPEFLNRFDAIIVFKPLAMDEVTRIARLLLQQTAVQLQVKGILFRAEDTAAQKLAELGFDPSFGARPLRRVIQERVGNALADLLLRNSVKRRDTVVVNADLSLRVEKAKEIS